MGGPLTRRQAFSLTLELLEAFRHEDFQRRWRELEEQASGTRKVEMSRAKRELRLMEQTRILPKYGFPGTVEGVEKMVGALGPFQSDEAINRNMQQANELLGLSRPQESWSSVSNACRRLQEEPRATKPKPRPAPEFAACQGAGGGSSVFALAQMSPCSEMHGGERSEGSFLEANNYDPWPPGKCKPFSLYVVGSWNDNVPVPMIWESGVFSCVVTVGADAMEVFQLLENKDWSRSYYPSVPNATQHESHTVQGPDMASEGRSWLIGGSDDGLVKPGDAVDICVFVDSSAHIVHVDWQLAH